jgi:hypothetical protein
MFERILGRDPRFGIVAEEGSEKVMAGLSHVVLELVGEVVVSRGGRERRGSESEENGVDRARGKRDER